MQKSIKIDIMYLSNNKSDNYFLLYTQHLESLGAKYIDREYFLEIINNTI